jgi:hypothetical protein
VVALDVVGVAAGVEAAGVVSAELLLLLEELPQPARTTSPATSANAETLGIIRVRAFWRGAA